MQYPAKTNDKRMTSQLEDRNKSRTFIINHNPTLTSKMSQSSLRRNIPFKMSAAVIFFTAYIISALVLPGKIIIFTFFCLIHLRK